MKPAALRMSRVVEVLRADQLVIEWVGQGDVSLYGIQQDSRQVGEGDLFVAWQGTATDAHDHVADAAARGAAAAIVERFVPEAGIPQLVVRDGRRAGALAADLIFASPWKELFVAGVTGTNGKTTTAALMRHLLSLHGPAASIGTLGTMGPDGTIRPGTEGLTTPGPIDLSRRLRELADEGVASLSLEASSHALDQRRLDGIRFDAVVFTNLSQDHLDYHGSMQAYRAAKLRLLDLVRPGGAVVVNAADSAWAEIEGETVVRFAVEPYLAAHEATGAAQLTARDCEVSAHGTRFTLSWQDESVRVELPLVGGFNVENATAAAAVGLVSGLSLGAVAARLATAPAIPGRLERVLDTPFVVFIDFAHTPDALERVLSMLRPLTEGRLVVLFGAGGDRDRTKRRPMARAVARWADRVWLTSDNPRTEDPQRILDDLAEGLGGVSTHRQPDRRLAIQGALAEARPGDVVVLAGKGHERTQVIGHERHPFDERQIVAEACAALEART